MRGRVPLGNQTVVRRTKSIGTKLTTEEYAQVVRVAEGRSLSEWLRDVLLGMAAPQPADHVLLAEMLAVRTIVLNLQFALASGEPPTSDAMKRLIERADDEKHRRAFERLTALPWRP
jgi:hypothetical protein